MQLNRRSQIRYRVFRSVVAMTFCVLLVPATGKAAIVPRLEQGQNLKIAAIGTSLSASASSTWFGDLGTWLNATTLYRQGRA